MKWICSACAGVLPLWVVTVPHQEHCWALRGSHEGEMLQVHVDVKLAASDGCGTSRKDALMQICVSVWCLCGDHSCVGSG
eukprot:239361-Rhodomonas_salina.1